MSGAVCVIELNGAIFVFEHSNNSASFPYINVTQPNTLSPSGAESLTWVAHFITLAAPSLLIETEKKYLWLGRYEGRFSLEEFI